MKQKVKVNYKYPFLVVGIPVLFSILIYSFIPNQIPPKTYTVTKYLPEWQGDADTLTYISVKIGYPMSKAEADIYQAALQKILRTQYEQIIVQLANEREQDMNYLKKDSTNAVKPKNK